MTVMQSCLNQVSLCRTNAVQKIMDKLDYLPKRVQHQVKRQTDQVMLCPSLLHAVLRSRDQELLMKL